MPELCENDRGEWKLFIKNLPWSADDDMVWTEFGKAGEVCYARVCTEQETGRSRGFGFVCYKSKDAAQKAIDMLNGKNLDGREIVVRAAEDRRNMSPAGAQNGGRSNVCYAFQKGECNRGDSCRFSHDGEGGSAPASSAPKDICFSFQKGNCTRGSSCRFSHAGAEAEEPKKANKKITFGDDDDEEAEVETKPAAEEVEVKEDKKRKAEDDAEASPSKKAKKSPKWVKVAKKAIKKSDGKSLKIKDLVAMLSKKGIEMDKKALKKGLKSESLFSLEKKVVTLA